jgi:hypothetical protein
VLDRITLHTAKDKTQKRVKQENISKGRHDKGQLAKLLSYHPTTAVQLHMEGGKVVDGYSKIVSNIMNWPFFLDLFQLITMMKRRTKYIE